MKNLNDFINEDKTSLEKEMEEWEERMKSPYGQALKELQCEVIDAGLYATSKNEYGLNIYTPFDNYVTAYALDGNKQYTYKKIKAICDDYEYTEYPKIIKALNKLEKLSK